jgi:hypothetical protein
MFFYVAYTNKVHHLHRECRAHPKSTIPPRFVFIFFILRFWRFSASGVQKHHKKPFENIHVENVLQNNEKNPMSFFRKLFSRFFEKHQNHISKKSKSTHSPPCAPPPPPPPLPQRLLFNTKPLPRGDRKKMANVICICAS